MEIFDFDVFLSFGSSYMHKAWEWRLLQDSHLSFRSSFKCPWVKRFLTLLPKCLHHDSWALVLWANDAQILSVLTPLDKTSCIFANFKGPVLDTFIPVLQVLSQLLLPEIHPLCTAAQTILLRCCFAHVTRLLGTQAASTCALRNTW